MTGIDPGTSLQLKLTARGGCRWRRMYESTSEVPRSGRSSVSRKEI